MDYSAADRSLFIARMNEKWQRKYIDYKIWIAENDPNIRIDHDTGVSAPLARRAQ